MPKYRAAYTAAERRRFAAVLRDLMQKNMLSGAELARKASLYLPEGKTIGRDNISWYLNGRSVPSPPYLEAIARVFNVIPATLLPRAHGQAPGEAEPVPVSEPREVKTSTTPDGRMRLQLDVYLPVHLAMEIVNKVLAITDKDLSGPQGSR